MANLISKTKSWASKETENRNIANILELETLLTQTHVIKATGKQY